MQAFTNVSNSGGIPFELHCIFAGCLVDAITGNRLLNAKNSKQSPGNLQLFCSCKEVATLFYSYLVFTLWLSHQL